MNAAAAAKLSGFGLSAFRERASARIQIPVRLLTAVYFVEEEWAGLFRLPASPWEVSARADEFLDATIARSFIILPANRAERRIAQ